MRETAIIIGAMKAGTTTLHSILNQHPEICAGHKKELDFFRKDREPMPQTYFDEFPRFDPARHRVQLDSSPNYSKLPRMKGVPERIAAYDGPVRMIYIMRDPVARIHSHIYHNFKTKRWHPDTLTRSQIDFCIEVSSYHKQLEAYARAGLENDILLLDFQQLVETPVIVAQQVFAFLDLAPHIPKDTAPRHVSQIRKSEQHAADLERCCAALASESAILKHRYGFVPIVPWQGAS